MNQRLLIIRFGSLGDVLLTTPTVLNLKLARPCDEITYLTKERFAPLVKTFEGVDEVVALPEQASARDFVSLLLDLDRRNFDLLLDLHGSMRSWLARKLITANSKIVYPKRRLERRAAVRRKLIPRAFSHTIDLYNNSLSQLGLATPCRRPLLKPSAASEKLPFEDSSEPIVVVAPGAAHPTKQWPLERFSETARILHAEVGARIVWAVTSADVGSSGPGADLPPDSFVELVDCPIEKLAAVMELAQVTVANDSGIAHLSSAVGTPVVSVFGPTHPALGFSPRGFGDRVIEVDEACRPCSLHGKKDCYREERFCFNRITSSQVAEAAAESIASVSARERALLVDRDGTVIVDKDYLSNPDQIELIEGSVEALRSAAAAGYKLVIVSNQSGVARGYFGIEDVERVNARLLELLMEEGVQVDALYYCPHHPTEGVDPEFTRDCGCRKPGPGMAEQAALELSLDLRRSIVVGDSLGDLNLARVVGAKPILVRTGYGRSVEEEMEGSCGEFSPPVFDDLRGAVQYVTKAHS
ncbi:MAG: HAD-IIIA family hydrolase [bacterium]|nr:HAD-IIIA family hydrolase [bacterium]